MAVLGQGIIILKIWSIMFSVHNNICLIGFVKHSLLSFAYKKIYRRLNWKKFSQVFQLQNDANVDECWTCSLKEQLEWLIEYIPDCTHLSTILWIAFTIIIALLYALCKTVGEERSENTNYLPEWKTIVETQWLTFFVVVVWLHSGKMLLTKLGSSFLRMCPHPARGQLGQGSDWMWRGS